MQIISLLVVSAGLLGLCYGQPCSPAEFSARISAIECAQSDRQFLLDAFNECGRDDLAEEVQHNCRTHHNKTCSEMLNKIVFGGPVEIRSCFTDDSFQVPVLPCTAQCEEDLVTYINQTLGCCSYNIFHGVLPKAFPSVLLIKKQLIDECNIPLKDPCTTPSTLSFTPSAVSADTCTESEVFRKIAEGSCIPESLDPRLDLFRDCMYPSESYERACEKDAEGTFCAAYAFDNEVLAHFDAVNTNCIEGADTCSEMCRAAVESVRENVGCCANNAYNTSLFSLYSTSYELWSMCEVETLEYCSESGSGQVPAAAGVTKTLFVILAFVLAFVI